MNFGDTLRGLWRRWYIVVPGLVLTIAVAVGAWVVIKPDYERTATQLLLPGTSNIPEDGNPYLYLGGLSQAADVLVTAMSSERELDALVKGHPGAEVVISRDPVTSGPQLLTTVTARSDAEAGEILDAAVARTSDVLSDLQDVDGVTAGNRIGVKSITIDAKGTLLQKTRLLGVSGAAIVMLLITLLTAGLVDGLSSRKRRRIVPTSRDRGGDDSPDDATADGDEDEDRSLDEQLVNAAALGSRPVDARRPASPGPVTRRRRPLRRTR